MTPLAKYLVVSLSVDFVIFAMVIWLQGRLQKRMKVGWWGPKNPLPTWTWPYIWRSALIAAVGFALAVASMKILAEFMLGVPR